MGEETTFEPNAWCKLADGSSQVFMKTEADTTTISIQTLQGEETKYWSKEEIFVRLNDGIKYRVLKAGVEIQKELGM